MHLFVGLGNPGEKYRNTRHNIGFMALDRISDKAGGASWKDKFQAKIGEVRLSGEKIFMLKPQTYMNLSGQSVREAMRFYTLSPAQVTVFHDELDLPPGKCRAKTGGGHAGHNGLRSLNQHIGAEYNRIRLGIGHPGDKNLVSYYILHDFAKTDQDWLNPLLDKVADAAYLLAKGDSLGFINKVSLPVALGKKTHTAQAKKVPTKSPLPKTSDIKTLNERNPIQKLMDKLK